MKKTCVEIIFDVQSKFKDWIRMADLSEVQRIKTCRRHKILEEIKKGHITIEIRTFNPLGSRVVHEHDEREGAPSGKEYHEVQPPHPCCQCLNEIHSREEHDRIYGYHGQLNVSRMRVPTPSSYEDFQRQISRVMPTVCSLFAEVERKNGEPVCLSDVFRSGEVIVFREIRRCHDDEHFDHRLAWESRCSATWEEDVFSKPRLTGLPPSLPQVASVDL